MEARKARIVAALDKWIRQRPGLEFGNYGDVVAYRSELRSIGKDRQHADAMLQYISWRDSITADNIIEASRGAFSGRLSIKEDGDRVVIDYCTGQYWPTEYRRAVCAVLSSAIWERFREDSSSSTGLNIRATAAQELGRSIARRWFN